MLKQRVQQTAKRKAEQKSARALIPVPAKIRFKEEEP